MKSGRYGLGLRETFSKSKSRYRVILIIAALASLFAYLIGTVGEMNNLQWHFQANSTKHRRVLSRFFLGCELIYKRYQITNEQYREALSFLKQETYNYFSTLCF